MSHTNSTPNYALPQFLSGDKPAWLTDINGAFSDIDTAIDAAKDAADAAQGDATQALTDAGAAGTTATSADTKASGALASIADTFSATTTYAMNDLVIYNGLLYKCIADVTTPGAWTGSTNWNRITIEDKLAADETALSNLSTTVSQKADASMFIAGTSFIEYTDFMPTSISSKTIDVASSVYPAFLIAASVWDSTLGRYEPLPIMSNYTSSTYTPDAGASFVLTTNQTLGARVWINTSAGLSHYNNQRFRLLFLVYNQ